MVHGDLRAGATRVATSSGRKSSSPFCRRERARSHEGERVRSPMEEEEVEEEGVDEEVEEDDEDDEGEGEEAVARRTTMPLRESVLREMLTHESGAKITSVGLHLSSVLVRAFVMEAWHRAASEAERSCASEVDAEHLEKILPQLLLDFT